VPPHELGVPHLRDQLWVEASHLRDGSLFKDPLTGGDPIGLGLEPFGLE
jgi:hypothetical protein